MAASSTGGKKRDPINTTLLFVMAGILLVIMGLLLVKYAVWVIQGLF